MANVYLASKCARFLDGYIYEILWLFDKQYAQVIMCICIFVYRQLDTEIILLIGCLGLCSLTVQR